MPRLGSSWREVNLDVTRGVAERIAPSLGITRVAEITWLDRIGIPVYASIRPDAADGSLCVNAGKGISRDEARTGALMEAIEFGMAELDHSPISVFQTTPAEMSQQNALSCEFVDFSPVWQAPVDPAAPIDAVHATDMVKGNAVAVPAELVFFPYRTFGGQMLFGYSTNGLSSGNTVKEALLHGLCELIERDILSFNYVHDRSAWVHREKLPATLCGLIEQIESAGMSIALRYTANAFGLPFFQSYLITDEHDPIEVSLGSGLHVSREIAAVRAITEAAQSRLSHIHGGRDDLIERRRFFASHGAELERVEMLRLRRHALASLTSTQFCDIEEPRCMSIDDALALVCSRLQLAGMGQVLYVELSPSNIGIVVLRVIVPGLEFFNRHSARLGKRLVRYIQDFGTH